MPTDRLIDLLRLALQEAAPGGLCVAFSGGPDSTALLHALAQLPEARARGLRALHVDHGLRAESAAWAEHCSAFCASLHVPFELVRVAVGDGHGEGIEAAARRARYGALAEALGEAESLALAHHRDDQVETVLLKLLRGAGPEGLGGMRASRPFARGRLWRPLLDVPRAELRDYVARRGLACIDDPANRDPRFRRNALRNEILPQLAQHWPSAGASILHAAERCRAASEFIAGVAEAALAPIRHADGSLDAGGWLALHEAVRAPALDCWLRARDLPAPPDAPRVELERQAISASKDASPCIKWPGAEVRIWAGRLHAMRPLAQRPQAWQATWDGTPLVLPGGGGSLSLAPAAPADEPAERVRFNPPLIVRLRRGGERIKPAGNPHTRELRDLFQQARTPPWQRERCPLVYAGDELIAVADLWMSDAGHERFAAGRARPVWQRS